MFAIINILYFIVFISYLLAFSFIVFHILRYSINWKKSAIMLLVFIPIFFLLLSFNVASFSSIDFSEFININFDGFSGYNRFPL
ncbi:MAG: hypothetical protein UR69_C0002G0008 [Candidatus Moranbacteria bacterium GW2011_GWE2_35_2-]|nr:MAG: hypothetical protein UR69_C0002G0008 [Candidatus Moranbacteria bacterium GW2011_GWE2_35_2-]KKQ04729.1 MAG: hypothetical protein US15_C0046G0003 [Candidatus Moranbacteria bacterium GW2011_GWF1_36_4]KKQ22644.1 MAG: hypothetical protein US37_C0002G0269 [Candidatus Moranbacteria bacterium GW2011_GWF2_37_11]KKQ29046.1 MAG: hypothetical protein US44_C0004G0090 [Candidatus Moranbacteria bacterium GW2011_GWD1_37_17]KKQ30418.1 MAG: hypothetical protein US47_C0002G0008 [Candidatus Moranbacteria b